MNDADPYIAAVADACTAAGLIVADYCSDDIDPRDGVITIVTRPDADPDGGEDWQHVRILGWDEERGWLYGRHKDPHGGLSGILYLCDGPLPDPADVAEAARRVMAGEVSGDERHAMMRQPHWRDRGDEDDGFEEQLAVYCSPSAPSGAGAKE